MSVSTEQWEFLKDVRRLIQFAEAKGFMLTGGELRRSDEQQAIYYDKGLSDTMESLHLLSLAIDFNVFVGGRLTYDREDLEPLGLHWESLNPKNRWGGNFTLRDGETDTPHFERRLRI